MDVHVNHGAIQETQADTLIVNLFEGVTAPDGATGAVDSALNGTIRDLAEGGDLKGKLGEVAVLYPRGVIAARRVLIAGLGPRESFDLEAARRASAAAARRACELGARRLASIAHGAGSGGLEAAVAAQATVEGALLALYRYRRDDDDTEPDSFTLVEFDAGRLADLERGLRAAEAISAGVRLTRDLVNAPPNVVTPKHLADTARELARTHGLTIEVGDRDWIAERGMGALLAVAQGAARPPAFITLEHNPGGGDEAPIILVGKGITFDSGGLSLKTSSGMASMKQDMAGAGAVIGAMKAVALLELPIRVVALAACTENMPDGAAYRPSDVITASDGTAIEIVSTDAEGRLVLADALHYAKRYRPRAVINLATLTGSCVTALGEGVAAGLFCNDEDLRDRVLAAGRTTAERAWPLPLYDDYRCAIRSKVADIKNSGGARNGVGTSAVFLEHFTDYPWAHLDIAPMAYSDDKGPYTPAGGTGYGVRLLLELLRSEVA